jgi:predicted acetyltransferase
MEIRKLTEEDYMESIKLSMYAFQYKVPEERIATRIEKLKDHKVFGIWEQNNLAAKLHIIPLHIYMFGEKWKMGGIAGVAAYPEYRRSGYITSLMIKSLKQMREDKQIVSLLAPFDFSFYRKYGWEILSEFKKITIEKHQLKFLDKQAGFIKRFSKDTHNDDIEKVYQQHSIAFSGMLVRDSKWWLNHVYDEDSTIAVYYNQLKEAIGYIIYNLKERKMEIQELAALDQEARIGLWNFICQHDSMVEKIVINLSIHDPFPYFLPQPKVKMELTPYFMARIVDVERVFRKFPFLQGMEALFLHIEDSYAPWNNGSYLVGNGEVKAFKEKTGGQCVHPPGKGIQLTINALSAVLFGYKRPKDLYEMNILQGSKEEVDKLERMVPNLKSAFYDYF